MEVAGARTEPVTGVVTSFSQSTVILAISFLACRNDDGAKADANTSRSVGSFSKVYAGPNDSQRLEIVLDALVENLAPVVGEASIVRRPPQGRHVRVGLQRRQVAETQLDGFFDTGPASSVRPCIESEQARLYHGTKFSPSISMSERMIASAAL